MMCPGKCLQLLIMFSIASRVFVGNRQSSRMLNCTMLLRQTQTVQSWLHQAILTQNHI